ncbi:hypothetical protein [Vagococcus salmoninarum]|uniref:hypothetical protein n=1 Tax=Vagococcus salmoninarum TaxID=2739 RepID=UPI00187FE6F9|nr:hypothetical protein [Vagococcus salmoninarum]MBE9390346.1 hypothetical protein [Vagococcus salmoninarum]
MGNSRYNHKHYLDLTAKTAMDNIDKGKRQGFKVQDQLDKKTIREINRLKGVK